MRQRAMTWTVFERTFKPLTLADGSYSPCEYADVKDCDVHHVWSVVEDDRGRNWYLIPGFHVVNMMGYFKTENPWTDAHSDLSVLY